MSWDDPVSMSPGGGQTITILCRPDFSQHEVLMVAILRGVTQSNRQFWKWHWHVTRVKLLLNLTIRSIVGQVTCHVYWIDAFYWLILISCQQRNKYSWIHTGSRPPSVWRCWRESSKWRCGAWSGASCPPAQSRSKSRRSQGSGINVSKKVLLVDAHIISECWPGKMICQIHALRDWKKDRSWISSYLWGP